MMLHKITWVVIAIAAASNLATVIVWLDAARAQSLGVEGSYPSMFSHMRLDQLLITGIRAAANELFWTVAAIAAAEFLARIWRELSLARKAAAAIDA